MKPKRFHVTWFIDQKKTMLAGVTVEAKDIIDAVKVICKKKIAIHEDQVVNIDCIKYVMEV
jgi:hypothetical protein